MTDEIERRVAFIGARRFSKSVFLATQVALALKTGRTVVSSTGEEIVGVPGFDDGRQLPSPAPIGDE